jgi:two-component system, NarL family, sensor histidine kinase LiaS
LKKQSLKKGELGNYEGTAAAVEERRRISRELHDRVLQLLSSLRLRAEMCRREFMNRPDVLEKELATIEKTAEKAVVEIRRLLADDRTTSEIVAGSLERRLREEMEIFRARSGMKLEFRCAVGEHVLPVEVERELYFALREGLINAVRHSRASELILTLVQEGPYCKASLIDNGSGFDLAAVDGDTHYGLRILRERIERVGGNLRIDTARGHGTRISIEIPVKAKNPLPA